MSNKPSSIIKININNKNKFNKISKGFSLLELVVTIIITAIILSSIIFIYREFMRVHSRQGRVMLIERSLEATSTVLKDSLTSLPGRGLATSNSTLYAIPLLPFAGSIYDGTKNKQIRLGTITPYKINGNDAFTVVYSDTTIPRLPLDLVSTQIGTTKVVRVPLPNSGAIKQDSLGSIGSKEGNSNKNKGDLLSDDDIDSNPNPSTNSASSAIANPEMFQAGQLMLLIDSPIFTDTSTQPKQPISILVRLVNVSEVVINNRRFLQFAFDICQNNNCGQLTNDPLATTTISDGAILAPLKLTSFYLQKDSFGNKLIRNDGGLILPDGNNGFTVSEGTETIVGETDSFKVDYHLRDGAVIATPINPLVSWLSDVLSVDITITGGMPGTQGSEYFNRSAKINFPTILRNIQ